MATLKRSDARQNLKQDLDIIVNACYTCLQVEVVCFLVNEIVPMLCSPQDDIFVSEDF